MNRSLLIDGLKAVASQVIVLHHLALYAPMADRIAAAWPDLIAFLSAHGRLAVQVFLVIGGYLTARSLLRRADVSPGVRIGQRYLRLAPQLVMALLLVIAATALVGRHLAHEDWLSPLPSPAVFLVHLLFLQDVLGVPSLSAGLWYVAIDFQLFALFVLLARFTGGAHQDLAGSVLPVTAAISTAASILFFSRQPGLDVWAIYFLSAYGLGALAAWAGSSRQARVCWWMTVALLVADWVWEPRVRPVLALATALALLAVAHIGWSGMKSAWHRVVHFLSDVSYSVFLCHFAVIVLVSGLWVASGAQGLWPAVLFSALAWALSIALGTGVQRLVDRWVPAVLVRG